MGLAAAANAKVAYRRAQEMTDLDKLTEDHGAALIRLEAQEKAGKKSQRAILIALVTALGSGGGVAVKSYFDYRAERDAIQADAEDEAEGDELDAVQWETQTEAIGALNLELEGRAKRLADLETRLAKAEVAIEFLTADQRWIRSTANKRVDRAPKAMPARRSIELPNYGDLKADPKRVQKRKAKILQSLD